MTRGSFPRLISAVAAAAFVTALLPMAQTAQAADNGAWAISPTKQGTFTARQYFFLELSPGATVRDSVTVKNAGKARQVLDIYPADAFNVESGAGFALRKRGEKNNDVGSWITLDKTRVEVPPEGSVNVPFTLTVPRGASPGDHAGGIVSIEQAPAPSGGNSQILIQRALAVRTYVRVSGPLTPSLVITKVDLLVQPARLPFVGQQGGATVTYTVRNSGNVRLSGERVITLEGLFGRTLRDTGRAPVPEILPGSTVVLTESFTKMPVLNEVTANVRLIASDGKVDTSGSASALAISWVFLFLLLMVVGAIILAVWWSRREANLVSQLAAEAGPLSPSGERL